MRCFYSGIQKVQEAYLNMLPSRGKILMFHQVENDRKSWIDDNVSITCNSFRNLIETLISQGNEFSSIDKIGFESNKIYITFDDGFLDTFTNAYPILKKYNIPFCIFITTNYINMENYMSFEVLNSLAVEPLCTIGAHTLSHPLLRYESDNDSYNEINESKYFLEKYLGRKVEYFAYPYGSIYACSKRNIKNVKMAGYKMAFSTLNSHLSDSAIKSKYFIPRMNVNEKNCMNIE